ncbi:hypothetical protein ACA910_013128 [Epithemia clementina (nom. ined.)]
MTKVYGVQPTAKMYNTLMAAWMDRRQPRRVEALYQELNRKYQTLYNKKKQKHQAAVLSLKPNAKAHTTRLQAWSKAGVPEKAAEALRDWMDSVNPDPVVDNNKNYYRHNDDVDESELPTTQAFNAVLHAWLRSNHANSVTEIENGIRQMYDLSSSGQYQCRPDLFTFSTALSALANSDLPDAGQRAMKLFYKLKRMADGEGEELDDDFDNGNYATSKNNKELEEDYHEALSAFDERLELRNVHSTAKKAAGPKIRSMEPDFFVYANVLVALIRSLRFSSRARSSSSSSSSSSHSDNHAGSVLTQEGEAMIYRLRQVVKELKTKDKSFWRNTKNADKMWQRIQSELDKAKHLLKPEVQLRTTLNDLALEHGAKLLPPTTTTSTTTTTAHHHRAGQSQQSASASHRRKQRPDGPPDPPKRHQRNAL